MHGFGFQIDLKIFAKSQSRTACWQNSTEAVFLSNHKVQSWISVIWQVFSFGSPYYKMKKVSADFCVKSSWEVHWMFQEDAVCSVSYAMLPAGRLNWFNSSKALNNMPPQEKQYRAQFQRINFLQKIPKLQLFYTIKASTYFEFMNAKQNFHRGWQGGEIRQ